MIKIHAWRCSDCHYILLVEDNPRRIYPSCKHAWRIAKGYPEIPVKEFDFLGDIIK